LYPKHIEGTWQFNGPWLGSYRVIATDQDIKIVLAELRDIVCQLCEYPEAVILSKSDDRFPSQYYCPECGTVWGWYIARCPDCDKFVWNKGCKDGLVKCSICDMEWDIETVKEINNDPEFHNEGLEDE